MSWPAPTATLVNPTWKAGPSNSVQLLNVICVGPLLRKMIVVSADSEVGDLNGRLRR
jgi:hypothetical protein